MKRQIEIPGLPLLDAATETALRQEWRTPPNLIEAINRASEYPIDLDCAASEYNSVAPLFYSADVDSLRCAWYFPGIRHAYCNPGFANMKPWIQKAAAEIQTAPENFRIDVIGLCSPSAEWFKIAVEYAAEIRLLSPRPQFVPPDPRIPKSSNAHENALFRFVSGISGARIKHWIWR